MTVPNAGKRLLETDVMFLTSLLDLLLNCSTDNGDLASAVVDDVPVEDLPLFNNKGSGDLASEVVVDILFFFFFLLLLSPSSLIDTSLFVSFIYILFLKNY